MIYRGYRCRGHLHNLLARFRQGGTDLRMAIEAQSGHEPFLCGATPAPDHDREGGESGPQAFTEIARLGKTSGRHHANTDERWRTLLHQGEHYGSEQAGLDYLNFKPPGVEHLLQHLQRHLISLIVGRASQDVEW